MVINVGAIDDPVPYYAAADVFVLPTFYDPCSLSVSEAAASGLPSVTTRFNGAAELLTEGVDGSVISDPADDAGTGRRTPPALRSERPAADGRSSTEAGLETFAWITTATRSCRSISKLPDGNSARRKAELRRSGRP